MSVELDAVDECSGDSPFSFQPTAPLATFHEVIFAENEHSWGFSKMIAHANNRTDIEERTGRSFAYAMQPMEKGGSVSGGINYSWGDENKNGFSAWTKAEAHDDKGNKVEAKVEKNSDGSGSVNISGTREYKAADPSKNNNNQDND